MKTKYDKKKRIIIISILILIIIGICLIIYVIKMKSELNKNIIIPSNYYQVQIRTSSAVSDVYKGEIDGYKIYEKLQMIFEIFLPDIYSEVNGKSDQELIEYYNIDKKRINNILGITTSKEFVDFIKKALKVDCDFVDYEFITYISNSYELNGTEESIKFNVRYKNKKELSCILYIDSSSVETVKSRIEIE